MPRLNEIPHLTDGIANAAFPLIPASLPERREALASHEAALTAVHGRGWRYPGNLLFLALHGEIFRACIPSFRTVMESGTHTQETAAEVSLNFQRLSEDILNTRHLNPNHPCQRDNELARRRITGKISEIGVLGTLWRSVDKGWRDERTYILPTSRTEDSHNGNLNGLNGNVDMVLRATGSKKRQPIQVKTTPSDKSYHNQIAKLVVTDIMKTVRTTQYANWDLLRLLANGDDERLRHVNAAIEREFERAHRHEQAQALPTPPIETYRAKPTARRYRRG